MQTVTPAQNALINNVNAVIKYVAVIGGATVYVADKFSVSREISDLPNQVSLLGTVNAATAQVELSASSLLAYSPYQTSIVPAPYPLQANAPIQLRVQYMSADGLTVVGDWPRFTGFIDEYTLSESGGVIITAYDSAGQLQGSHTLPGMIIPQVPLLTGSGNFDNALSPLAIVDNLMRQAGQYLTPAPASTDRTVRANYLILSSSGFGGHMPDVGTLQGPGNVFYQWNHTAGKWAPSTWDLQYGISWDTPTLPHQTLKKATASVVFDGWVKSIGTGTSRSVGLGSACFFDGTNTATANVNGNTYTAVVTGKNLSDGVAHYVRVIVEDDNIRGVGRLFFQIDAATATTAFPAVSNGYVFAGQNIVGQAYGYALEAFEAWMVPEGIAPPTQDRSTWTPPIPIVCPIVPTTRARVISYGTDDDSTTDWQRIQSVAQAYGDLCWFEESGALHWDTLTAWSARRTGTPSAYWDDSDIDELPVTVKVDGLRNAVSATVKQWNIIGQTTVDASAAYVADQVIVAQPGISDIMVSASDGSIAFPQYDFVPQYDYAVAYEFVPPFSWHKAVQTGKETDPAAASITNLDVEAYATQGGIRLRVTNPNSFAVSFVQPNGSNTPALVIHGSVARPLTDRIVTQASNPLAKASLDLGENQFRQAPPGTVASNSYLLVSMIAGQVYSIIPELGPVKVPGNPALQIGDLVSVYSQTVMNGGPSRAQTCMVVSISEDAEGASQYDQTYGLRPIGAPTGWILGVPGRSELGVTTYLGL